jgi:hypothetical protein
MDRKVEGNGEASGGELKIKGQAEAERRKSKWENEDNQGVRLMFLSWTSL